MANDRQRPVRDDMPRERRAFTLLELLVVLVVTGMLLALVLPAIGAARQRALRVECQNHLRQVGVALQNHQGQFGSLPLDGENGYGFGVFLLPFVGEPALYSDLNPGVSVRPALAEARPGLDDTTVGVFLCPSRSAPERLAPSQFGRSNYLGSGDLLSRPMSLSEVIDGESSTVAAGETITDQAWVLPGLETSRLRPNGGGRYGSRHSGGAFFVLCDGAVRFVSDDISQDVFQALCTPAGSDRVGTF